MCVCFFTSNHATMVPLPENAPTMSILMSILGVRSKFFIGARVAVKNVSSVVGMIKQSVLKQAKKGGGSG